MNKKSDRNSLFKNPVVIAAVMHRHIFPIAVLIIGAVIFAFSNVGMVFLGAGAAVYGIYTFIGYKLRFSHILCSHQLARRKPMTPDNANWNSYPEIYAYGETVFYTVLGVALIIIYFMYVR